MHIIAAGDDLVRQRRPVIRRAALDDVGNEYLLALQAHGHNHLIEQVAGAADERPALLVFVLTGALAYKQ